MSNFEKASNLASEWVESMGGLEAVRHDYGSDLSGLMQALEDAGLLMPDMQIIHTVEELEALDPDTVFMNTWGDLFDVSNVRAGINTEDFPYYFPCSVVASGGQVRAAREAMEQDNG